MQWERIRAACVFGGLVLYCASQAFAQEPEAQPEIVRLPEVLVTAPARLPEISLSPAEVPASVQVITGEEIRRSGALNLQDFMQQLPGVHLNDEQGNSYQPDL